MSKEKDRDIARQMYLDSNGEIPLIEIADKLGKPPGTIRGWKSRYKWDKDIKGVNATLQSKKRNVAKNVTISKNEEKAKKKTKNEIFKNNKLTDKQQLFCMYYLKYFNATKAYQKAYQADYMTANAGGSRLLANDSIKAEIERLKAERLAGMYLDGKVIMQQYIDIAFADMTDFVEFGTEEVVRTNSVGEPIVDEDGNPLTYEVSRVNFRDDTTVDGSIISEISEGKNGIKVKLHDKMRALEWLANNLPEDSTADLEIELLKLRLDKEKAQTEKIQAEINKLTGNDTDIEDVTYLRELVLEDETH